MKGEKLSLSLSPKGMWHLLNGFISINDIKDNIHAISVQFCHNDGQAIQNVISEHLLWLEGFTLSVFDHIRCYKHMLPSIAKWINKVHSLLTNFSLTRTGQHTYMPRQKGLSGKFILFFTCPNGQADSSKPIFKANGPNTQKYANNLQHNWKENGFQIIKSMTNNTCLSSICYNLFPSSQNH